MPISRAHTYMYVRVHIYIYSQVKTYYTEEDEEEEEAVAALWELRLKCTQYSKDIHVRVCLLLPASSSSSHASGCMHV